MCSSPWQELRLLCRVFLLVHWLLLRSPSWLWWGMRNVCWGHWSGKVFSWEWMGLKQVPAASRPLVSGDSGRSHQKSAGPAGWRSSLLVGWAWRNRFMYLWASENGRWVNEWSQIIMTLTVTIVTFIKYDGSTYYLSLNICSPFLYNNAILYRTI